jgi:WD40 repeat protein
MLGYAALLLVVGSLSFWLTYTVAGILSGQEEKQAHATAVSPDGRILASGSTDRTVRLWDVKTGEILFSLKGHSGPITCLAFSEDGRTLASGSADRTVRLWNVGTGKPLAVFGGCSGTIFSLTFARDGKSLISANENAKEVGEVRAWELPPLSF